jgi:DNA-binding winged helix-turn-helix (wHTH) protein
MIGATTIATRPWHEKGEAMLYAFGNHELDTQLYELRRAGQLLKIEPQVFNVLAYLIEHRHRTVTRQELLEHLWPEQYISDAVLSYCIMAARKAVGDSGRVQRIIKTVHGRGFRFVAALQERDHKPAGTEVATAAETPGRTATQQHNHTLSDTTPGATADSLPGLTPLATAPLVTVLCATLANVTALAEQLGFNTLQRLRQAFFALAQHLAQQYQGTQQFFGADGILLLFGLTQASTEHARRAVLAALELQRRLPTLYPHGNTVHATGAAVRMGIHSGPVVANSLSGGQPMAATTSEATVYLAVWLQYTTQPGTLLTSEATIRLLANAVQCTAHRDIQIPGQPHLVKTYTIDTI